MQNLTRQQESCLIFVLQLQKNNYVLDCLLKRKLKKKGGAHVRSLRDTICNLTACWSTVRNLVCIRIWPAYVVGFAGVLQRQTVGLVFVLVGADGNDGLTPAFCTRLLILCWTGAKQHPIAVFTRNLDFEEKIKENVHYFMQPNQGIKVSLKTSQDKWLKKLHGHHKWE